MSQRVITMEGIIGRVGGLGLRFTFTPDGQSLPTIDGYWAEMHVGSPAERADVLQRRADDPNAFVDSQWVTVRMKSGDVIVYGRFG